MPVDILMEQQAPFRQVLHDLFVGRLHELTGEGVFACDDPLQVNGLDEGQLLLPAYVQVLVAEGWSDVDDSRAVV